ncbi:MAG: trehalose-phosphatase [Gemmatimonadota bacterium]
MAEGGPYRAVVADLDGVITRTSAVHERAWSRTFDAFLRDRGLLHGPGDAGSRDADGTGGPFSRVDYQRHVNGKPRYDGVRDFLASRGLELPEGDPSDEADRDTVHGLGNRKNEAFRALLAEEGVEAFADAVAALERWRRGGLRLALISASRNARHVLRSADLASRFDAVVDGETAAELGLAGKREIFREAAARLDVDPADAVALEDSAAGVRAAADEGFGLVAGVVRDPSGDGRDGLARAGAHVVVPDLVTLRFRRAVPCALDRRSELLDRQGDRHIAVFLDFDGTLSPIVREPGAARMAEGMRPVVEALAGRFPVAVVSGRDRPDVEERVGIRGLFYAGSHGLDIAGPGRSMTLPEADGLVDEIDRIEESLRDRLGSVDGVVLERKRFSLAVHYRMVDEAEVPGVIEAARECAEGAEGLRLRPGKKVAELEPDLEWDKGRAVEWILEALGIELDRYLVLYLGDDETDEDAFRALAIGGVGIRVGPGVMSTRADYRLADPDEVRAFLGWLAERGDG